MIALINNSRGGFLYSASPWWRLTETPLQNRKLLLHLLSFSDVANPNLIVFTEAATVSHMMAPGQSARVFAPSLTSQERGLGRTPSSVFALTGAPNVSLTANCLVTSSHNIFQGNSSRFLHNDVVHLCQRAATTPFGKTQR